MELLLYLLTEMVIASGTQSVLILLLTRTAPRALLKCIIHSDNKHAIKLSKRKILKERAEKVTSNVL
jgi:hypothetical protein